MTLQFALQTLNRYADDVYVGPAQLREAVRIVLYERQHLLNELLFKRKPVQPFSPADFVNHAPEVEQ